MSELQEFLENYAKSYESYDPIRVAGFIFCPCMFLLRDKCVLLDTNEKIKAFMADGLKNYRSNGCVHFTSRLLDERRIGPSFAIIDVEWSPENAEGQRTMHFSTTYNLVHNEGRWQVSTITRHDN